MFVITNSGYTEITENIAETMMDISMRNRGKDPLEREYTVESSPERHKVTEEGLVAKTDEELVAAGIMTSAELTEKISKEIRDVRDGLLSLYVDKVNAVRWAAMTPEEQTSMAGYRQALLDIPEQSGFPENVTWPEVPEVIQKKNE